MQEYLMNKVYETRSPNEIPWNVEIPPKQLVELVESKTIEPCKAIDFGCGLGNYANYLTTQGFDALGIDMSPKAIELARESAAKKNLKTRFEQLNMLGSVDGFETGFEFAYDWGVLHHILPDERPTYLQNVLKLISPTAKYLSVCFSEKDTFLGEGKLRESRIGSKLYFSSEEEMRGLYEPYFHIHDLKTIEIFGNNISHKAVFAFMERK